MFIVFCADLQRAILGIVHTNSSVNNLSARVFVIVPPFFAKKANSGGQITGTHVDKLLTLDFFIEYGKLGPRRAGRWFLDIEQTKKQETGGQTIGGGKGG